MFIYFIYSSVYPIYYLLLIVLGSFEDMAYPHVFKNFKKITYDLIFNPLNYEAWFSPSKNLPSCRAVLPGGHISLTLMVPLGSEGCSQISPKQFWWSRDSRPHRAQANCSAQGTQLELKETA